MRDGQKTKAQLLQELDSLRKRVCELEQAEQKIEELAKLPAENPNPVLRVTKDGTIIHTNEACDVLLSKCRQCGCQAGESLPDQWGGARLLRMHTAPV